MLDLNRSLRRTLHSLPTGGYTTTLIVTSNRGFEAWGEILGGEAVAKGEGVGSGGTDEEYEAGRL